MKTRRDNVDDLMTLDEVKQERSGLAARILSDSATVRELRRFRALDGLIANFDQAKLIARPSRDNGRTFIPNKLISIPKPTAKNLDCDICGHSKATIFLTSVKDGHLHKENYCGPCAAIVSAKHPDNPMRDLIAL